MGRKPEPERRQEILDVVVEHLLGRGLHDLSLRPLGAAVGVSPRVLIYHFGTKEDLISEALSEASRRQREMFGRWMAQETEASPGDLLLRFWRWLSSEETEPYVKLFFDVYALGLRGREGFAAYPEGAVTEWISFAESSLTRAGLGEEEARSEATLLVATVRGLLLDLLATSDRERVEAAVEGLARRVERHSRRAEDASNKRREGE